jgi:poly-gamma-glutamate synthesis protein (capsule biosynthesis protein)
VVRIAAVGDVLLHSPLQRRGFNDPEGYRSIWKQVEPFVKAADIAYANLEGPVAPGLSKSFRKSADPGKRFDNNVYSSYPLFNYHPDVVASLKSSGFDVVTTSNNHALDRGDEGVNLTIEHLRKVGLHHVGTIVAGEPDIFAKAIETKLGRIVWIGCTYSTNGISDSRRQVLFCYRDRDKLLELVERQSRSVDVAAVIVAPHWGHEYHHKPNQRQKKLAVELVAAGAAAVIGSHPHVIQPWEVLPRSDSRNSLVIYSTGNFISGQAGLNKRTGLLVWMDLCANQLPDPFNQAAAAKLLVARAGWIPLLMTRERAGPKLLIATKDGQANTKQAYKLASGILGDYGLEISLKCTQNLHADIRLQ